jgi:hypothetical protein
MGRQGSRDSGKSGSVSSAPVMASPSRILKMIVGIENGIRRRQTDD